MGWRALLIENRAQKLGSLALAALIWLTVRSNLGMERLASNDGFRVRVLENIPVGVLGTGQAENQVQIRPAMVHVEIEGDPDVVQRLTPGDVQAYVNLLSPESPRQGMFRVNARAPGVRVAAVLPESVRVERSQ
ncbi:MAG: hypothetical protein RIT19_616 [Verrucomicrobiota bacterium]|jgi:hypothetical protein